jgi:isochorismate synthase
MTAFALYRLPHEQQVTLVEQTEDDPQELPSCEALNGHHGFVVAPFSIDGQHPLLLIRPDVIQTFEDGDVSQFRADCWSASGQLPVSFGQTEYEPQPDDERTLYGKDFAFFHQRLKAGDFQKIVLSRCSVSKRNGSQSPICLFQRACQLYPRMFIAMVYTAKSGLWLTATPEILLEGTDNQWRTIALAGTMKLKDEELLGEGETLTWSTKNIQEQRYVATYLKECLEQFSSNIQEEGPRTVRAANLVHLRSDFTFTLLNSVGVGTLLQALHPTPAVCGLPKEATYHFITSSEHTPRLYYSGFMGPLNVEAGTHLYVSLRCMQITDNQYRMYAGGGLLKDSVEEQEWQETEAKMETMRRVLKT